MTMICPKSLSVVRVPSTDYLILCCRKEDVAIAVVPVVWLTIFGDLTLRNVLDLGKSSLLFQSALFHYLRLGDYLHGLVAVQASCLRFASQKGCLVFGE
jgi:hypothetical protein